jgi:hypothetical protein
MAFGIAQISSANDNLEGSRAKVAAFVRFIVRKYRRDVWRARPIAAA